VRKLQAGGKKKALRTRSGRAKVRKSGLGVLAGSEKTDPSILTAPSLVEIPWLVHGFSTRRGGHSTAYGGKSFNLGFTKEDSREAVEQNRAAFLKQLGANNKNSRSWPLVSVRQIHSDIIHCISEAPEHTLAGDGLITATPGLLIAILTADCLPVILVDAKHRAVGVFHAGWRGTLKRIVEKGVGEMRRCFGTSPRDILAAIGPGIHSCCYQVGEEVQAKFESQFAYGAELFRREKSSDAVREKYPLLFLTARAPGHSELPVNIFLDLVEANRRQLQDAGVLAKNIHACEFCTASHPDMLFSYRADKGRTGRMMAVAGIRP
jgi:polyphenol oxidase